MDRNDTDRLCRWLATKDAGFFSIGRRNYCETIGRVCMDQLMIRLPQEFPVGTKVTLIGKNADKEITMQDIADH